MVTLWIGDFRTKQIQQYLNKSEESSSDHSFLVDDLADYEWFINDALVELPLIEAERADVVVALGFNDCVYSCTWNSFNISQLAVNYINKFNALVNDYPGFNFYFCSVNPVNADYPFAEYPGGTIQQSLLNSKIVLFNNTIKNLCTEHYIDTYNYLTSTGFETRDGVRFQGETISHLQNYIKGQFKVSYSTLGTFVPRLTAPNVNDESIIYWKHKDSIYDKQGFNPCIEIKNDLVIPNCVGYAWGRFMEILEYEPNITPEVTEPEPDPEYPELSTRNAKEWWGNDDGYDRGQIPRLGAVACWSNGGYGHVAIVEQINADGSIVMSESNYRDAAYNPSADSAHFRLRTGTSSNQWGIPGFSFQGFIYNPRVSTLSSNITTAITSATMLDYVPKSLVYKHPGKYFADYGVEQQTNARYIWQYLGSRGWSLNAVAGILGNIQTESKMNPALLEKTSSVPWPADTSRSSVERYANDYRAVKGRFPGYGLTQWTGKSESCNSFNDWDNHKLIKWCDTNGKDPTDIDSQLDRIIYEMEHNIQFGRTNAYPMTFREFSVSTLPASYLGKAFLRNYERPANPNYEKRGQQAEYWYNYLISYTPAQKVKPVLSLENVKVEAKSPTKMNLSFVVRSGNKGLYRLFSATDRQLDTKVFDISSNSEDTARTMSFSLNNLTPNTFYKIEVEVAGTSGGDTISKKISFLTPQNLPSPVTSLSLVNTDTKFPPDSFRLTTGAVSDWGYWKKNASGYIIQLIVNGKCISEKTIQSLPSTLNFKISNYFTNYESKLGDTIQIGVRTWVTDDNGNKQYDSFYAKTSNTICFLKQPILTYLNTD